MGVNWSKIEYFRSSEFDSPDSPGSGAKEMEPAFIEMLSIAREIYGMPMIITSGFRTIQHNEEVGGVDGSAHVRGWAADISCRTSKMRFALIESLRKAGFNRIGIANTFVHVDCDPWKTKDVIWTY